MVATFRKGEKYHILRIRYGYQKEGGTLTPVDAAYRVLVAT
jgi:hypothetical protein